MSISLRIMMVYTTSRAARIKRQHFTLFYFL